MIPLNPIRKHPFLPLLALSCCRQTLPFLGLKAISQPLSPSSGSCFLCVCLCISHEDSSHVGFRAHPIALWSPFNWLHFQQPNFQIKSHFELTGVRMYLLGGDTTLTITSPMAIVNLRGVGTQTLSLFLCYSTACDLDPAGSPQGPGWDGGRSWLLSLSTALDLVTWLLLSSREPGDRGRASFQAATWS